jgi:hypothetical protein
MSDNNNFSQIPINISNSRQQQQQILTNPPSSSNLKSVSIHSNSNLSTNNNNNNNKLNNHNSNSNNNINNGVKTNSTTISNNKQLKSTNDSYDLDYLDLNELNAIISKLKSDSYSMSHSSNNKNHNYNNNEKSPKLKNRLSLNIDNNNKQQLPPTPLPPPPPSLQHQNSSQRRYESNLFKELIQFGIKKEKLEKALAATGYSTSLEAINWLMKHSRDPILLNDSIISTRDYMLVMCPVGRLAAQISSFFQQAKLKCGPNEAHYNNLLPYMKLSPFFKVLFLLSLNKPI